MAKRRRCECCKGLVNFVAYIERDGFGMRVCEPCLQRGDKIFHGRGPRDFTTHSYQTSPCNH
jgi:hypothetical protein